MMTRDRQTKLDSRKSHDACRGSFACVASLLGWLGKPGECRAKVIPVMVSDSEDRVAKVRLSRTVTVNSTEGAWLKPEAEGVAPCNGEGCE
jgi:hypothetical protein